jgi:predicted MFS family arabinose efflux permease
MTAAASPKPAAKAGASLVGPAQRQRALRFVLLIGALSLFADCTYEGARGINGPFLGLLGASALAISFITGLGELVGYALRLVSGRAAARTQSFWPIIITGYVVQMASVPALALAHTWTQAAALILLERIGKGLRNPPRDALLSHAGQALGGYGWVFGLHEALDQTGAVIGPLLVAMVLAWKGHDFRWGFAVLLVPALINLTLVLIARRTYPKPQELVAVEHVQNMTGHRFERHFWIYLAAATLVAAGFADFPLLAFHLHRGGSFPGVEVSVAYALAMATAGAGSLAFGRWFDRAGLRVLLPLTAIGALFAPLIFLGGTLAAWIGVALWGIGKGVQESLIPAAVAPMVAPEQRAEAYGLFTAGYGLAWFVGSVIIGWLYEVSLSALVTFCLLAQIAALPLIEWAARRPTNAQTRP